jgi:hypothetical protein
MKLKMSLTILVVMLFAAGCSNTRDEINSLKESGECRKAEQLIKEKYSGQNELYNLALVYTQCDKDQNKGLKVFKNLASDEYLPAMARLINLNAASPQMIKRYNILQCRSQISTLVHSRKRKISSIQRSWSMGGGARYGSGGLGRAGIEAEIWADVELNKLAVWENNELKRCNSMGLKTSSGPLNPPPAFNELKEPQNGSNSTASETNNSPMTIDNSCIQDGGTQMCYNRQSQRYGNSSDNSGISSPYSGVSGQTGISGMSSPYD